MYAWRNPKIYLSLILGFVFIGFLVLPLASLLRLVFFNNNGLFVGLENFSLFFKSPNVGQALANSIQMSFFSSVISLVLSFFFAYGIYSLPSPFQEIFEFVSSLLLLVPTIVMAVMLLYLFGQLGIFTRFFGWNIKLYGLGGILATEVLYSFPILSAYFRLALGNINPRLYQAAETLGARKFRRFYTITLPALKGYFFSGFMIAFILAFTDFGAPKILGGNYNVLSTEIFKQVIGLQNANLGAVIALLLLAPSLIFFILNLIFSYSHSDRLNRAQENRRPNLGRDLFYGGFCGILSCGILLLTALMFVGSFIDGWPYNLTLSLASYQFSIMGSSLGKLFSLTVTIALISSFLGTTLCFLSAYLFTREIAYPPLRRVGSFLAILPSSIPGLVLGLSYVYFFNNPSNPLGVIYNTATILVTANIIHFFTQPFLAFSQKFQSLSLDYENVQKIYGGSWLRFLVSVIAPLSLEEILYSLSYLFVNSMVTLSALIFLYAPQTRVLAVLMVSKGDEGNLSIVFALAVLIFIANFIFKFGFTGLLHYFIKKKNSLKLGK